MREFVLVIVGCSLIQVIVGLLVSNGKLKDIINSIVATFMFYIMINSLLQFLTNLQF